MASYPRQVATFPTHHDNVDTVFAADPNNIQDEVIAVEKALGINPQVSSGLDPSKYQAGAQTFADLSTRVANIEAGLGADTHGQYVRKSGDIMTPSATGDGLTIQLPANYNGRPIRVVDSNGNTLLSLDGQGNLSVSGSVTGHVDPKYTGGVSLVNALPATGAFNGQMVLLAPNFDLFAWDSTARSWHGLIRRSGTVSYNPGLYGVIFRAPTPRAPYIVDGSLSGYYEILSPTLMFIRINYNKGSLDFSGDQYVNLAFGLPQVGGQLVIPAEFDSQEQMLSASIIHNSQLKGTAGATALTSLWQFGYSAGAPQYGILSPGDEGGPLPFVAGDTMNIQGVITTMPMSGV